VTVERRYALIGHTHGNGGYVSSGYLSGIDTADGRTVDNVGFGAYYHRNDAVDLPAGVTDQSLLSLSYSADWTTQLGHDWRTNRLYTRTQNNGVWGSWKKVVREDDTAILASSDNSALPVLGTIGAASSLVLRYSADPLYGMQMGVLGSGNCYIDVGRHDSNATAYSLILQPNLGNVYSYGKLFAYKGGETLALQASDTDHTYMAWYARTATPGTRSGYMGYGGAAATIMEVVNQIGDMYLSANGGAGVIKANGSEIISRALAPQLFNDMDGNVHGYYTDFNSASRFGPTYIQGTTNGPGTGGSQFFTLGLGIGSNYTWAQYNLQLAWPRAPLGGSPQPAFRCRDNGTWGTWYIHALTNYGNTFTASQTFAGGVSHYINGWEFNGSNGYLYANAWIRLNGTAGLYTDNNEYIYPRGADGWNIRGGGSDGTLNYLLMQDSAGTARAYLAWNNAGVSLYGYPYGVGFHTFPYQSYGSAYISGSYNGYAGICLSAASGSPNLMFQTGAQAGGIYNQSGMGWILYFTGSVWQGPSGQALAMNNWSGSCIISHGTGTPSGGSDGDIYMQHS
jgi:hypothetical protein